MNEVCIASGPILILLLKSNVPSKLALIYV